MRIFSVSANQTTAYAHTDILAQKCCKDDHQGNLRANQGLTSYFVEWTGIQLNSIRPVNNQ